MSPTKGEGVSKVVNAGSAFLKHRRFINSLQALPEQERRARLASYQEGLTGASRVGLQAMLAAKAKPENPDVGFLQSVAGRARVAMEARAALGSPAATSVGATGAAVTDPEALFEADRQQVLVWFALSAAARESAIIEHIGQLSQARHQMLSTHILTMLENTKERIAHHKENEDQAWGGFIEDRISYNMARLQTGGHDPAWQEQLRELVSDAERLAAIGAVVETAQMTRSEADEPAAVAPAADPKAAHSGNSHTPPGVAELIGLIEDDDPAGLMEFLATCPPAPRLEAARTALAAPYPEIRMAGLNFLALQYARTPDAAMALSIAEAVATLGRAHYEQSGDTQLLDVVASAADIAALSRATLGRADELIAGADDALAWLALHGSGEKRCNLNLAVADAELARGALRRAEQYLLAAEASPLAAEEFGTRDRMQNLRGTYNRLAKQPVTELASPSGASPQDMQRVSDQLATIAGGLSVLGPQEAARSAPVIAALQAGLDGMATDPLGANDSPMEALADLLGAADHPSSQIGLQKRIRMVGRVLADPEQGHDRALLGTWICTLDEMAVHARAQDLGNDLMNIRWCLQLCHRRRDEHEQAAAILHDLWLSLEEQRATIDDPIERAGVLSQFPFLFGSLAASLYRIDRRDALLGVIEGAKGRLIEDTLDRNRSPLAGTADAHGSLAGLPAALERASAHYLTYLVDDDCVYAVLVAADRSVHTAQIDLARKTLRSYAAIVNPIRWGQQEGGLRGPVNPSDLPERLASLVSWLEPLIHSGVIGDGDHLCYCPDDELHLIPLHLLPLGGGQLLDRVSTSRVHSAWAVLNLLSAPSSAPQNATVVEVPGREDPEEMAAGFSTSGDRLLELLPGSRASGAGAGVANLEALGLTGRAVHFTTHGTFPTPARVRANPDLDPNPFRSSGLLLAHGGELPSKGSATLGELTDGLLSPERIAELNFTGSHVTLQACSTGLSVEGAGGDALGLEWALLRAGASSVLTTHWDVGLGATSEFCRRFYGAWLDSGQTRATAWRSAARDMEREGWPLAEWAGMALSGDWR